MPITQARLSYPDLRARIYDIAKRVKQINYRTANPTLRGGNVPIVVFLLVATAKRDTLTLAECGDNNYRRSCAKHLLVCRKILSKQSGMIGQLGKTGNFITRMVIVRFL